MRPITHLLPLIGVIARDRDHRPTKLHVPGSDGKHYDVLVRRSRKLYEVECLLSVTGTSQESCPGNLHGICYHTRAAVAKCALEQGYKHVSFCKTEQDAQRIQNLTHGKTTRVASRQSGVVMWLVYR